MSATDDDEQWIKKYAKTPEEQAELRRFAAEVRRVNPALPIPAQDEEQCDALDAVAIFAAVYATCAQREGQIPKYSQSVRVEPNWTMRKHASLYDMEWVREGDDPETRFWYLQKLPQVEIVEELDVD